MNNRSTGIPFCEGRDATGRGRPVAGTDARSGLIVRQARGQEAPFGQRKPAMPSPAAKNAVSIGNNPKQPAVAQGEHEGILVQHDVCNTDRAFDMQGTLPSGYELPRLRRPNAGGTIRVGEGSVSAPTCAWSALRSVQCGRSRSCPKLRGACEQVPVQARAGPGEDVAKPDAKTHAKQLGSRRSRCRGPNSAGAVNDCVQCHCSACPTQVRTMPSQLAVMSAVRGIRMMSTMAAVCPDRRHRRPVRHRIKTPSQAPAVRLSRRTARAVVEQSDKATSFAHCENVFVLECDDGRASLARHPHLHSV